MLYQALADAVVVIHFLFILFVLLGGLGVCWWPKLAWTHVPAFLWGGGIELFGGVCPLTNLENYFRAEGLYAGTGTSYVEHYLVPLIYPELMFPSGFPRSGFIVIGLFVLLSNAIIYWCLWMGRGK